MVAFWPNVFPIIIIVLSLLASVTYAICRAPAHAMYWLFAACLNISVLFMKEF